MNEHPNWLAKVNECWIYLYTPTHIIIFLLVTLWLQKPELSKCYKQTHMLCCSQPKACTGSRFSSSRLQCDEAQVMGPQLIAEVRMSVPLLIAHISGCRD